MMYIVSVLVILMHIKQVMPIFVLASELREGGEKAVDIKQYEALPNDNPNFGQMLLSQRFISSARELFNKERLNAQNNDFKRVVEERYHMKMKNEDTGKNKGDNVRYYAMDFELNDMNSENDEPYSLLDHYGSNNVVPSNKRSVQCVKTSPINMLCNHGGIIYKLILPNAYLTEDDLGKLVETVYKEIEVGHKGSFLKKLHKRDADKIKNYIDTTGAVALFANEGPKNILQFTLPDVEHNEELLNRSLIKNYRQQNTPDNDKYLSRFEYNNISNKGELKTRKGPPPSELLFAIDRPLSYSCRWLSKRHIPTDIRKTQRRALTPKCHKSAKSKRLSVNKCQARSGRITKKHRLYPVESANPSHPSQTTARRLLREGKAGTCRITKKPRHKVLSLSSSIMANIQSPCSPLPKYAGLNSATCKTKVTPSENNNKLLNKKKSENQIKHKEKKQTVFKKKYNKQ